MSDYTQRQACYALWKQLDTNYTDGDQDEAIGLILAFAQAQQAEGIREAKFEVERIYAGCSDYDQGLEKIQDWCEARTKELEA